MLIEKIKELQIQLSEARDLNAKQQAILRERLDFLEHEVQESFATSTAAEKAASDSSRGLGVAGTDADPPSPKKRQLRPQSLIAALGVVGDGQV